jgi:lysophospholipase L1-like esterase
VKSRLSLASCLLLSMVPLSGCASPVKNPDTAPTVNRAAPAVVASQEAPANRPPENLQLPDSDQGLPGTGPIRRYPWFRELWLQRRQAFARQRDAAQGAVVFFGDSITQGWGDDLGHSFGTLKVANRGISGDTTRGLLIRISDVLDLHPKAIVLLIGTNDIEEGAEPSSTVQNVGLLITELHRAAPSLPVFLCEIFPSSPSMHRPQEAILRINEAYADLAKREANVHLVRTWALFADAQGDAKQSEFPDLLHPNAAGYAKWAEVLRPLISP